MKTYKFSVVTCTFLIFLATMFTSSFVQASPTLKALNITASTNKQSYYLRENVNIHGNLTSGGSPVDSLIALEVHDPQNPLVFRTVQTGGYTSENYQVNIISVIPCIETELFVYVPTDKFELGTTAWFKATVKNNYTASKSVTLCVNVYDGTNIPLGSGTATSTIPAGLTSTLYLSVNLPTWAYLGTGTVYASAFTDNPRDGGTPYCQEKSASFEIVRGAMVTALEEQTSDASLTGSGITGVSGAYSVTFRLPPAPRPGQYSVYLSSKYQIQLTLKSTTFDVADTAYPPQASFTYTPPSPVMTGRTVTFDASASSAEGYGDSIISYKWNFGDGNITAVTSPIIYHAYAAVNTYIVTLNVTDSEGLWCTTSKPITVLAAYGPTASFTYTPTDAYINMTISFDAGDSEPGWNGETVPIVSYEWDFGDLNVTTVSAPVVYHKYTGVGNYTVTLNVTDQQGLWNVTSKAIEVKLGRGPIASFYTFPSIPFVNGTTEFNAGDSEPGWNGETVPIVSYEWDFGDLNVTTVSAPVVYHKYTSMGNYTVILNVTDQQGLWNLTSKTVAVSNVTIQHDITITSVTLAARPQNYPAVVLYLDEAYPTWLNPIKINVTLRNIGTEIETFTVSAYYGNVTGNYTIGTQSVTNLAPGENETLTFNWQPYLPGYPNNKSQAWPYPEYIIFANTSLIPDEINPANNKLVSDDTLLVKWPGDADGNGYVRLPDLVKLAKAWYTTVGNPNYNPQADFDLNGEVKLQDLVKLAKYWYKGPLD